MIVPYHSGFYDPLISIGLFQREMIFDYIELRVDTQGEQDWAIGHGLQIKQRFWSIASILDLSSGGLNNDQKYESLRWGVGWQFERSMLYVLNSSSTITSDEFGSRLVTDEYAVGLQRRSDFFGIFPFGVNVNFEAISPQTNILELNGRKEHLDGLDWRWNIGLKTSF